MQAAHGIAKLHFLQKQPVLGKSDSLHASPFTTVQHDSRITLKAVGLSCERGERLLFKNLSLVVTAGQCLHVTGANGSGKTSLLKIISGINQADNGQIQLGGADHCTADFYAQSTYIGHKDGLKNELTAAENLTAYHLLESGQANDDEIDSQLAQMGILDCADLTAEKLSFGQRRRLVFARLLQARFCLWILDEPFTGIDKQGRKLMERLCVQHLQNNGMIVLTNHQSMLGSSLSPYIREMALQQV